MIATRSHDRTRVLVLGVVGLALVSMSTLGISLALFTSQTTVPNNAFTAGTLSITTDHSATAVVSYSNMAPGDQVTNELVVSNSGTLDLRYAISSSATNADSKGLKDQLVLTVKSGVSSCTNGGFAATGTVLYTGDLDGTTGKLVGDSATGADSGDRNLTTASPSEALCWNVQLPLSTGNAFQGATTTATFTFDAEQTANN